MKRRVVVTGLGTVSPVGNNVADSWRNLLSGTSGIDKISSFDASNYSTRFAGQLKNFDPTSGLDSKEVKRFDPFVHYGLVASDEAIQDSGLLEYTFDPFKVGVAIGSGIGGLDSIYNTSMNLSAKGYRKVSPFFVPGSIINILGGVVAEKYNFKGANFAVSTACASASHSIGISARLIAAGDLDVAIVGGAEAPVCPLGLSGFIAARSLSRNNDSPERASCPWDDNRDGFVLSEGAGILVIEDYEHAKLRGAHIYAELSGFAATADAYHITSPHPEAVSSAVSIENALKDANLNSVDVDYINAHGTSTVVGDIAENKAIKRVFGSHAYNLCVSSTKSMTGHLLGAAGGVEAIYSILSIRDNIVPPTINLYNPAPECDLNYVPNVAQERSIKVAVSNSFGFGGTNSCLIFNELD